MNWFALSLFFHLIGVGMIFTLLFAGPIIETNFRWENDISMKRHSAKLLRNIGLLSPFGALVLILSGIGNMNIRGITFWDLFGSYAWLGIKLVLFIVLLIMGMALSPKTARQRALIIEKMDQPGPPAEDSTQSEDIGDQMNSLNKRQTIFFATNWVLVLLILILTLFKP
ncbi:MAG: hypothetical protein ACLP05_03660 [Candidatus Kryptoniota bacterium]